MSISQYTTSTTVGRISANAGCALCRTLLRSSRRVGMRWMMRRGAMVGRGISENRATYIFISVCTLDQGNSQLTGNAIRFQSPCTAHPHATVPSHTSAPVTPAAHLTLLHRLTDGPSSLLKSSMTSAASFPPSLASTSPSRGAGSTFAARADSIVSDSKLMRFRSPIGEVRRDGDRGDRYLDERDNREMSRMRSDRGIRARPALAR